MTATNKNLDMIWHHSTSHGDVSIQGSVSVASSKLQRDPHAWLYDSREEGNSRLLPPDKPSPTQDCCPLGINGVVVTWVVAKRTFDTGIACRPAGGSIPP